MNSNRFLIHHESRDTVFDNSYKEAFWPPASEYKLTTLNVSAFAPTIVNPKVNEELIRLEMLIREDWKLCISGSNPSHYQLSNKTQIAESFKRLADLFDDAQTKKALEIRAKAIEFGYSEEALMELTKTNEDVSFVAGKIGTWSAKHGVGLPSAFAAIKEVESIELIMEAHSHLELCREYLYQLHKHLVISDLPVFAPVNLFFAAGEANTHPKHVAYFLPEDEGILHSPFQKTFYFVNTHRTILQSASLPLAEEFLNLNNNMVVNLDDLKEIQTLGVFAHEIGHFVQVNGFNFTKITEKNKWVSHVMQETAADVFGILFVADSFASQFNFPRAAVVYYYLAECLRYMDRGLGVFSDSDGMFLQLNYFLELGALSYDPTTKKLTGNIIAALRSLARILADTLLVENIERTEYLYNRFGPAGENHLVDLLQNMAEKPLKSVEYV
jgi:hypothetical protein